MYNLWEEENIIKDLLGDGSVFFFILCFAKDGRADYFKYLLEQPSKRV